MEVRDRIVKYDTTENSSLPFEYANEIGISSNTFQKNPSVPAYITSYVLLFGMQGVAEYRINDKRKKLDQGALLFIRPGSKVQKLKANGVIMAVRLDNAIMCGAYNRISKWQQLDHPFDQKLPNGEIFFLPVRVKAGSDCFAKILDLIEQHYTKQLSMLFYFKLAEAILKAQHDYISRSTQLNFKRDTTRLEIFKRLNSAREFIEDNVHQNINLDELSCVSCLSKYHLVRTFKALYGKTPHQYHLDLRLRKIHALIHSDVKINSLNSLALDFGFSDYSVFYKHYKKNYKVKPSFNYC